MWNNLCNDLFSYELSSYANIHSNQPTEDKIFVTKQNDNWLQLLALPLYFRNIIIAVYNQRMWQTVNIGFSVRLQYDICSVRQPCLVSVSNRIRWLEID